MESDYNIAMKLVETHDQNDAHIALDIFTNLARQNHFNSICHIFVPSVFRIDLNDHAFFEKLNKISKELALKVDTLSDNCKRLIAGYMYKNGNYTEATKIMEDLVQKGHILATFQMEHFLMVGKYVPLDVKRGLNMEKMNGRDHFIKSCLAK